MEGHICHFIKPYQKEMTLKTLFFLNNCQPFNSTREKREMVDYFIPIVIVNYIFNIYKQTNKQKLLNLFIECTILNCNGTGANGMHVSIFLKDAAWYLGVMGNLHNEKCLIYTFTGKVQKGTPSILNISHCHCWYK